jgi:adenylate cyclase
VPTRHRRSILAPIGAALAAVLVIGVVTWWLWPMRSSPTATPAVAATTATGQPFVVPRLSIVVLPFANLSNDPEQEYFADAITEDLTTDLSRIADSFVIARSTAFAFKGKSVDVKQIGHDLGVRYVLEGSVRRLGDQVQVNVQLIDAERGAHLWADRFETDRRNLAQAQSEITGRLARTLNLQLVEAAGQRVDQERAAEPDARDLVMRGRALFLRPVSRTTRLEGLQAFERALAIDPESVEARIGIANILVANILDSWSTSPAQDAARAEQLLHEVLQRNAGSAWAHFTVGQLRRWQDRLPESKIEFETAIALNRNYSGALVQLGIILIYLGQPEAAIPLVEKALQLDPHTPNIQIPYSVLGRCHLLLGHVDEAVELYRKARAANPQLAYIQFALASALGLKGEIDEARAVLAEAIRLKPDWNTLAKLLADCTYCGNPQFRALSEQTAWLGLRRAGLPDE